MQLPAAVRAFCCNCGAHAAQVPVRLLARHGAVGGRHRAAAGQRTLDAAAQVCFSAFNSTVFWYRRSSATLPGRVWSIMFMHPSCLA
jgi:hypothetical protein